MVNNLGDPILRKSMELAGRKLTLECGRLALQASGSIFLTYGDTSVLVAVTASDKPKEGIDFFPLTVDYEEKLYSVGKIPGGFIKREGRPSEKAILSCRLIDRPIRPLFPKGYRNDVNIVATVLSMDQDNQPDVLSIIGAAAALEISKIPFTQALAAVKVGCVNGELIINPTIEEDGNSVLSLTVAGTKDAVMMVEAAANEVSEELALEAILFAHEEIKKIIDFILDFKHEALALGIAKQTEEFLASEQDEELNTIVKDFIRPNMVEIIEYLSSNKVRKQTRDNFLKEKSLELFSLFCAEKTLYADKPGLAATFNELFGKVQKEELRKFVLTTKTRVDGRGLEEVRAILCEVGVLPRTHGSALFTRGETQILNIITLGPLGDEQRIDGISLEQTKRYMHHYNFPPYSVGEARSSRGPGRREIGHGALAEKALQCVIPDETEFPYALRLVSEALGSNGSTSMGSVCSSTLSLMDAGVPIKAPVAGVAMGLIKDGNQVAVLTDIQGMEDALGDMDFKVAGTADGITALQMDIKVAGIDKEVLRMALAQAKAGRMHILGKMLEVLKTYRPEISDYAPGIIQITISQDRIRDVIGPGGKMIKKIVEETGVKIDIEDDGRVFIAAVDRSAGIRAQQIIEAITAEVEVGKTYLGKVVKIAEFGAFVEVIPGAFGGSGKDGLVHISQLDVKRVAKVEDVVSEGDEILVKVIGIDPQGKVKLSRKDALPKEKA